MRKFKVRIDSSVEVDQSLSHRKLELLIMHNALIETDPHLPTHSDRLRIARYQYFNTPLCEPLVWSALGEAE